MQLPENCRCFFKKERDLGRVGEGKAVKKQSGACMLLKPVVDRFFDSFDQLRD